MAFALPQDDDNFRYGNFVLREKMGMWIGWVNQMWFPLEVRANGYLDKLDTGVCPYRDMDC
jgi:hypothetical protein